MKKVKFLVSCVGTYEGELIIKDNTADILGIGKKWKKIKVSHLI